MHDIENLLEVSKKLSLLFVEDDEELRKKTKQFLSQLFSQVDIAEDGEEGLRLYKRRLEKEHSCYDIVLTDIVMPNMNGIELCENLFSLNPQQTIVVLSAYSDTEYLIDLINMGVDGFIQKPFMFDHLIDVLTNICLKISERLEHKKIVLQEGYVWNSTLKSLSHNDSPVHLSRTEKRMFTLLINNPQKSFSTLELFELIYDDETKEFTDDSVKSIVKRLRKKLPPQTIKNSYDQGYSMHL